MNIHLDTPTEILHTILIGAVKYFWAQTMVIVEKGGKMDLFRTRLASVDSAGLRDADLRADYLIAYKGSLIGKHFKSLAQVMPFLIHDITTEDVLKAWISIGSLVVLLWHTEIADTEAYLVSVKAWSLTVDGTDLKPRRN